MFLTVIRTILQRRPNTSVLLSSRAKRIIVNVLLYLLTMKSLVHLSPVTVNKLTAVFTQYALHIFLEGLLGAVQRSK